MYLKMYLGDLAIFSSIYLSHEGTDNIVDFVTLTDDITDILALWRCKIESG